MSDIDTNEELKCSLVNLKTWLATRQAPDVEDKVTISAPEALRAIGFVDLTVEKFCQNHQDLITLSHDPSNGQKPYPWTELNHLVTWTDEFQQNLKSNMMTVAVIDLMKGYNEYPISKSKFHVEESLQLLESAINFELGFDITHPDTRDQNYAITNILFEDSTLLSDLVSQIFSALFSKCLVRLVLKTSQFFSAIMAAFIVDLMYQSGATSKEIKCLALDRRDSFGSEMKFIRCLAARKSCKLSVLAAVFKETDTFAAAQSIIESYFREQYPNLIVLVEESSYDRFIKDWQRYYSHALSIGCRLDTKTSVVDAFNSKVQIDLCAIDIKQAHKMSGQCINVLKFRNLADLTSLMSNLRKIPFMTLWNDDILMLREFCNHVNICQQFWLNYIPKHPVDYQLSNDMLSFYASIIAPDMADLYNSVAQEFSDEMNATRKLQTTFSKKDPKLRTNLILQAFSALVTKNKSLRNGLTVSESIARLRRFQLATLHTIISNEPTDSRLELMRKPVGLALIIVRSRDQSLKFKQILVEFIFKNLLIGNGVLLVCPLNTLGAKFSMDHDHVIPFKMVHDDLPDISRLSLETTVENLETSQLKKQCPNNTYAVEFTPETTIDACETIMASVGTRSKEIWFPDSENYNYWVGEP